MVAVAYREHDKYGGSMIKVYTYKKCASLFRL